MASQPPALEILVREPDGFTVWSGPPYRPGSSPPQGSPRRRAAPHPSRATAPASSRRWPRPLPPSTTAARSPSSGPSSSLASSTPRSRPPGRTCRPYRSRPRCRRRMSRSGTSIPPTRSTSTTRGTCPRPHGQWFCFLRMITNEIQFFDPKDFTKGIVYRVRVPGIAAMQLASAPGSDVAGFVPKAKGIPAGIQIFSCDKDAQNQVVACRSFFRCSTVQFYWNKGSTGLLVLVQADVDKTNQSYYGETKLNYLTRRNCSSQKGWASA